MMDYKEIVEKKHLWTRNRPESRGNETESTVQNLERGVSVEAAVSVCVHHSSFSPCWHSAGFLRNTAVCDIFCYIMND